MTIENAGKDEEQLEFIYIGGMYSSTTTLENNSMVFLIKLTIDWYNPAISFIDIYSRKWKHMSTQTCSQCS